MIHPHPPIRFANRSQVPLCPTPPIGYLAIWLPGVSSRRESSKRTRRRLLQSATTFYTILVTFAPSITFRRRRAVCDQHVPAPPYRRVALAAQLSALDEVQQR